jgi:hypothetical protein
MIFDPARFYLTLSTEINFKVDQKILETDSYLDTHKRFCVRIKVHSKLSERKNFLSKFLGQNEPTCMCYRNKQDPICTGPSKLGFLDVTSHL